MVRVSVFIDGFNLYHAINNLNKNYLKWVNLRLLLSNFVDQNSQSLSQIFYFSAFATWLPQPLARHRVYVEALKAVDVEPKMASFKIKDRSCNNCGARWRAHEEKESDVKLGICLINEAHKNTFDKAIIVSNDSDLSPVVRLFRREFPGKKISILTPPGQTACYEMARAQSYPHPRPKNPGQIKEIHLTRSLFPKEITLPGNPSPQTIIRPMDYDPPSSIIPPTNI